MAQMANLTENACENAALSCLNMSPQSYQMTQLVHSWYIAATFLVHSWYIAGALTTWASKLSVG